MLLALSLMYVSLCVFIAAAQSRYRDESDFDSEIEAQRARMKEYADSIQTDEDRRHASLFNDLDSFDAKLRSIMSLSMLAITSAYAMMIAYILIEVFNTSKENGSAIIYLIPTSMVVLHWRLTRATPKIPTDIKHQPRATPFSLHCDRRVITAIPVLLVLNIVALPLIFINQQALTQLLLSNIGVVTSGPLDFGAAPSAPSATARLPLEDLTLDAPSPWRVADGPRKELLRDKDGRVVASLCAYVYQGPQTTFDIIQADKRQPGYSEARRSCVASDEAVECLLRTRYASGERTYEESRDGARGHHESWSWTYIPTCEGCLTYSLSAFFYDRDAIEEVRREVIYMMTPERKEVERASFSTVNNPCAVQRL